MKSDYQIATEALASAKPIQELLNIPEENITYYGKHMAKIYHRTASPRENTKVVLVTAMTPTRAGIGKTTMSIALADGLRCLGHNAVLALREPSLGPVFGMKGGACGGGYAQVIPMDAINLHFTGDFHAISSANNLIAVSIRNFQFQNTNDKLVVPTFRYVMDMNARDLRESFDITPASEVMACFCLAHNWEDLRNRIAHIVTGYIIEDETRKNITVEDLGITGAVLALLKDAFSPNLVQTLEGTPAFVHGGPFANIAHGCSSVIATKMAQTYGDIVVTEAGFGADMGFEKYMDIVCAQYPELKPDCVVLVVTLDGVAEIGIENVKRHVKNISEVYNRNIVVCINRKPDDTDRDIMKFAHEIYNVPVNTWVDVVPCDGFARGSEGSEEFANTVYQSWNEAANPQPDNVTLIREKSPVEQISAVAMRIYHVESVTFSTAARKQLLDLTSDQQQYNVCIAKTQYRPTFSDSFSLHVENIVINDGARLIIPVCGNIIRMPGLPKEPNARKIDVENEIITGLS